MVDSTTNIGARGTGQVTNEPQVGDIGGQDVRPSLGTKIKQAFTSFGNKVANFFKGVGEKFDNWKAARAEAREQAAVGRAKEGAKEAATTLLSDMKSGNFTQGTMDSMNTLVRNARRANPDNPQAVIKEATLSAAKEMEFGDVHQMAKTDFTAFGQRLEHVYQQHLERHIIITERLNDSGIGSGQTAQEITDAGTLYCREMTEAVSSMKAGVKETIVNEFRDRAGGLVDIAEDGRISKSVDNSRIIVGGVEGSVSGVERIKMSSESYLQKAKTTDKPTMLGDVHVAEKAKGDWHRMHITIDSGDGQPFNMEGVNEDNKDALEADCAKSLHTLTGSDNATVVVSSMIHQYGWRDVVHQFASADGEKFVDLRATPKGYGDVQVDTGQGLETFVRPGQIGDAQYTVTKNGDGDFVIDVDWTYVSTSMSSKENQEKLQLSPDNPTYGRSLDTDPDPTVTAVKVHMTSQIVISGEQAHQGNLVLKDSSSMHHDISGKIHLPD